MKSNNGDLITKSTNENNSIIIKPILKNRVNNNLTINYDDSNSMRMNLFKAEQYPDPFRHITTTILQYPESNQTFTTTTATKQLEDNKETRLKNEKAKRMNRRNNLRYMTQVWLILKKKKNFFSWINFFISSVLKPVTLIEIKEIEEDVALNNNTTATHNADNK